MCRANSHSSGARRCPGCNSSTSRDAHNLRRRQNRAIRRKVVELAETMEQPRDVLTWLRAASPSVAKRWAIEHGVRPEDLRPSAADRDAPLRPDQQQVGARASEFDDLGSEWSNLDRWGSSWTDAPVDVRPYIAAIDRRQGDHPDEAELLTWTVEKSAALPDDAEGGVNTTMRVEFTNGETAYHKVMPGVRVKLARIYGQRGPLQPIHEVAAWQFAKELGDPYRAMLPPTVFRTINGRPGSLALAHNGELPDFRGLETTDTEGWEHAGFFDALTGQQDRHGKNYFVNDEYEPRLFDHGFAFANPSDFVAQSRFVEARLDIWPALDDHELRTLDRLLASDTTLGLDGILEPGRVEAVRARARIMRDNKQIIDPWGGEAE